MRNHHTKIPMILRIHSHVSIVYNPFFMLQEEMLSNLFRLKKFRSVARIMWYFSSSLSQRRDGEAYLNFFELLELNLMITYTKNLLQGLCEFLIYQASHDAFKLYGEKSNYKQRVFRWFKDYFIHNQRLFSDWY